MLHMADWFHRIKFWIGRPICLYIRDDFRHLPRNPFLIISRMCVCRRGRVHEHWRPKRTPLRREHHDLREYARLVRVPMFARIRAPQQLRMCRHWRVCQRGLGVPSARYVHQLAGQLQLQVCGRLRRRRIHL